MAERRPGPFTLRRRYPALTMLSQATRKIIEQYWAERFGFAPDQMGRPGVIVVPHGADLRGYAGLYAYRRDEACVVSAPEAYITVADAMLVSRRVEDVFDPHALSAALGDAAGLVVGPAALAYADASTFRPAPSAE